MRLLKGYGRSDMHGHTFWMDGILRQPFVCSGACLKIAFCKRLFQFASVCRRAFSNTL